MADEITVYDPDNDSLNSYGAINYSQGSLYNKSPVIHGSVSIRNGLTMRDYAVHRPSEKMPETVDDSIHECNLAYKDISIVRSVIDMMADFTVDGLRIEHRNPKIQNFINNWIKKVNFFGVSERIANTLYRLGNCPVDIAYAKFPLKDERKWQKAEADLMLKVDEALKFREIPLQYEILNPATIIVVGDTIPSFSGKFFYGIGLEENLDVYKQEILEINKVYGEQINIHNIEAVTVGGKTVIPLKGNKFKFLFYKKDDWLPKAWPMIHSILDPLSMLKKMHLADKKALDGAISSVRLWNLGNIEHKMMPGPAALSKLRESLTKVTSGDAMDMIWGPELTFKETDPKSYNFLKQEKYEQVMTEIYAGLGVPASLTGSNSGEGYNSSSISMKALVERLEYGRRILLEFWQDELNKLKDALKWKYQAIVSFDHKVMSDEVLEKKILIDLWDRNIISTKRIRELCRHDHVLEDMRIKKEENRRISHQVPDKAGPYHNSNTENELRKILMQAGVVTPSQLNMRLKDKNGEETILEQKLKLEKKHTIKKEPAPGFGNTTTTNKTPVKKAPAKKSASGQGRPNGSLDSTKRKRTEKPRFASSSLKEKHDYMTALDWTNKAQDKINDIYSKAYLSSVNKDNLRLLTKEQSNEFEKLKFAALSEMELNSKLNNITFSSTLEIDDELQENLNELVSLFKNENDREPTVTEMRELQSLAFVEKKSVF